MIYIACALHCEAKPLVDYFKLRLDRAASFPIFTNDDIALVVSGIGKLNMAAAVAYLYAHCEEQTNSAWLNIGVVGHATLAKGTLININKVTDSKSQKNWYPPRITNMPGSSSELISVDAPEITYTKPAAYDMEAAAFMPIVSRFTLIDLVQVLKVVSDNSLEDIEKIDKALVSELIKSHIKNIAQTIEELQSRVSEYVAIYGAEKNLKDFQNKWHFTQYQAKALKKLFQRAHALELSISINEYKMYGDAQSVLHAIEESINNVSLEF